MKNEDKKIYQKNKLIDILGLFFQASLISYLFFYIIDLISPNFITYFYNLNYHLITVIVLGVIYLSFSKEEKILEVKNSKKISSVDYLFVLFLSFALSFYIWYRLRNYGNIAYFYSLIIFIVVLIFSLSMFKKKYE